MKRILIFFLILFSINAKSSHLMGGEITWECLKNGPDVGKYIFTLKVYRDCFGINVSTLAQTIEVWDHPTLTGITVDFVLQQDVSPICDPALSGNPILSCAAGDQGAVEEYIFVSQPVVIAGVPPATGWHFTWDNCCRNAAITNLTNPSSAGFTLRASMFPYTDPATGLPVPADPCFDSSPVFKEQPKTILCTGFPFSYSHNAFDDELDELVYSWGEPLDDFIGVYNPPVLPLPLTFSAPYTVNIPLPGNPTLDSQTGEVSYDANTAGYFVTCVKVQAWKCNQLVAEIFREVQVVLINCPSLPAGAGSNNPPEIDPPLIDTGNNNFAVNIDTTTGLPSYDITVFAGQKIDFLIYGTDIDVYPSPPAPVSTPQSLTMAVSGGQFSSDYINQNNCLNPPCATFTKRDTNLTGNYLPMDILNISIVNDTSWGIQATDSVFGRFSWQTSCDHIASIVGCGLTSNVYTFLIKVFDDFCPANGIKFATIKVTVVPAPIDNSPDVRCVSVLQDGSVDITWEHLPAAPASSVYSIFHSDNVNGPFQFLDSVLYPLNTYQHQLANANNQSQYYYVSSHSSCAAESEPSDTLKTMFLDVTSINAGTKADLIWNQIHDPTLPTWSNNYSVFVAGNGMYYNTGSSIDTFFTVDAQTCNNYQAMYISLEDASGCISNSSINGAILNDTISPSAPQILDVSVNNNGKSVITWVSTAIDAEVFVVYIQGDNGGWLTLDTVYSPNNSYIYNLSNADNIYETFRIRALDSCENSSSASLRHNSINIETELDPCDFTVKLKWNEYINFLSGLYKYKLYVNETDPNGNINNIIIDLSENTQSYVLDNINEGSNYEIYVTAVNGDSTIYAISNRINQNIDFPNKPIYNYIEYASVVLDDGSVDISCLVDNSAIINYYDVFRSTRTGNSTKIGEIPFEGQDVIFYNDNTANTNEHFYIYRIYPVDTCGVRLSAPSTLNMNDTSYAKTILLNIDVNKKYSSFPDNIPITNESEIEGPDSDQFTNTISFNEYEDWLGDVETYELYRSVNGQSYEKIKTWYRELNPLEALEYIDVVTKYGNSNGRFCYYIVANEGVDNIYGSNLNGSFSNENCISQTPFILVPSAFTPNGDAFNELFIPITYYVSPEGYLFEIYNRSGMKIFSTDNPSKGWDGTYNNKPVQNDSYVYYFRYLDGTGSVIEKTNTFILVR